MPIAEKAMTQRAWTTNALRVKTFSKQCGALLPIETEKAAIPEQRSILTRGIARKFVKPDKQHKKRKAACSKERQNNYD